jgi:Cof subfamily protein (haloacid dehalogenase superfamily)
MSLKLVCIDLDGTLVGTAGSPTRTVWEAAHRARRSGLHLAISTARPGFGLAWDWAQRLDPDGWHQFQNGASLLHANSGTEQSTALTASAVHESAQHAASFGWVFEAYTARQYAAASDSDIARQHALLLGVPYVYGSYRELQQQILRVQYIVADHELDAALAVVPEDCSAVAATVPSIPGFQFVSITKAGVSKASGVHELARLNNVELAETMMIGDGRNDIPALLIVGQSVAMGNSHTDVLKVASHVVGHVDRNGVATALELAIKLQ